MQLLEILEGFTKPELNKLEAQLKEGSRKEPYKLFKELKKCLGGKAIFDKDLVLKQVYESQDTTKREYSLKNDLKSLKQIALFFVAEEELNRELKNKQGVYNLWLMKGLHRRQVLTVFDAEIDKQITNHQKRYEVADALELMKVKFSRHLYTRYSHDFYEQLFKPLVANIQQHAIKNLNSELRYWDSHRALIARVEFLSKATALKKDTKLHLDTLHQIDLREYDDLATSYYEMHTQDMLTFGKEAIPSKLRMLEILTELAPLNEEFQSHKANTLGNLSYFYGVKGMYQKAWDTLLEYEKCASEYKLPELDYIPFPKMHFLFMLKRYQEAIDYYHQLPDSLKNTVYRDKFFVCLFYCHVALGQTNQAAAIMVDHLAEANAQSFSHHDYTKRFGYIAMHIADKNWEDAGRELLNFKRSKSFKSLTDEFHEKMSSLVQRYIKAKSSIEDIDSAEIDNLYKDTLAFRDGLDVVDTQLVWLLHQLEKDIA